MYLLISKIFFDCASVCCMKCIFCIVTLLFQETKEPCHQGSKPAQALYLKHDKVFTTGFSRMSERQYALWDAVCYFSNFTWNFLDFCLEISKNEAYFWNRIAKAESPFWSLLYIFTWKIFNEFGHLQCVMPADKGTGHG